MKFQVFVGVDDARDDFFYVVGQAVIGGEEIVESFGGFRGRGALVFGRGRRRRQFAQFGFDDVDGVGVVFGFVVRYAAGLGVQGGSAQGFGGDHLPDGALH